MAASLYDTDIYLWTQEQSALIQERRWSEVDIDLVAEEIADLGREIKNGSFSFIRRILEHLLKLAFSTHEMAKDHWQSEIAHFRVELKDKLTKSIQNQVDMNKLYKQAVRLAIASRKGRETGFAEKLPIECPWTLEQVLDDDYWPEAS